MWGLWLQAFRALGVRSLELKGFGFRETWTGVHRDENKRREVSGCRVWDCSQDPYII